MKKLQYDIQVLASLDVDKYVRKATGKCEENVKIKIVIPLLELLGYNAQQDMDFEHHVRNKKADIALLFDNKPKLLIEVKDLDENLDNHIHQALDYAFSKGVEWVILTNGLEIRVYKSFIPYIPSEDRLIFPTTLSNLLQSFNALFELVGREHLQEAKKLTEKAESIRENITTKILIEDLAECRKRLANDLFIQFKARYETDSEFKEIIDTWATDVKMNISDPGLIEKLCREGAYTLINRVLFLRICEDKGHIKAKLSRNAIAKWREMVEDPSKMLGMAFEEIGQSFEGLYKSPLFDSINFEDIAWKADTINFVLDKLGEHDFSKISKDILGRAYEQHISRKERKELGQFYTPDFVIDYILDQVGISPDKKILDPACGSGGFLMKAYDRLRKQYLEQAWAEEAIHKHILKNNLYGIDINPFATQLTVMNLLLKDLDHPTSEMNIVDGDSLEKLELTFDLDIYEREHPLSSVSDVAIPKVSLSKLIKHRPFDIVISNPPYIFTRSMAISKAEKDYYKKHYKTGIGKVNTFALFIESGIERLKEGGKLGFIVPNTLLRVSTYEPLRDFILGNCAIEQIVDLGEGQFDEVTAETIIIILRKEPDKGKRQSNIIKVLTDIGDLASGTYSIVEIPQHTFESNPMRMFNIFVDEKSGKLLHKIENGCVALGSISKEIIAGVATQKGKESYIARKRLDVRYERLLEGKDIDRYQIIYMNKYILYDKSVLHRPRPKWIFETPLKLIVRRIGGGNYPLVATLDRSQYYTFNSINNIVLDTDEYKYQYILAILNSKTMNYYFRVRFTNQANLTVNISKGYLSRIPIKKIPSERQKEFVQLVDKMLSLNKQLSDPAFAEQRETIQKEIDATNKEIDQKVYELYGLTEEERQVIETSVSKS